ncbi:hypothetical protein [Dysgonomonas sp. 25]|uniref:hypothetical protein n=1 Tax=Dysgonomonas sp. 25 TaxID=2302933 RepID=UPI0013D3DDFF|nr:hypothetical protein [Dysgonomonas sp. 25]NDV69016.1 hypothetical protein [Dysgonomonas sp. 25]
MILKIKIIDLTQWLVLLGIVLGVLTEFLAAISILVLILGARKKLYNTSKVFIGLFVVSILSVVLIYSNGYHINKFIQQIVLLSVIFIAYGQFFEFNKESLDKLFYRYLKISYIVSLLGLIQFIVCFIFVIDIFPYTLDGSSYPAPIERIMPIHSILSEGGYLGTFLTPAIAFMLFNISYFKENKLKCILILVIYLLTFATVSYVMLLLIVFSKLLSKFKYAKYFLICATLLLIPILLSVMEGSLEGKEYDNQRYGETMIRKVTQTLTVFELSTIEDYELLNPSSYALLTNYYIATNATSRLIGTGLGTHSENYSRIYPQNNYYLWGLNSEDGYSLFNRILSEFGLFGIVSFIIFVIFNYRRNNIINMAILFVIMAYTIRGGHYTLYGTSFFLFFYYYTSRKGYYNIEYSKQNDN